MPPSVVCCHLLSCPIAQRAEAVARQCQRCSLAAPFLTACCQLSGKVVTNRTSARLLPAERAPRAVSNWSAWLAKAVKESCRSLGMLEDFRAANLAEWQSTVAADDVGNISDVASTAGSETSHVHSNKGWGRGRGRGRRRKGRGKGYVARGRRTSWHEGYDPGLHHYNYYSATGKGRWPSNEYYSAWRSY